METGDLTSPRPYTWKDFLFAPLGCLISIPAYVVFGVILIIVVIGSSVYYNVNTEIFGIGHPPYDRMKIDNTWEHITIDDDTWSVEYESLQRDTFQGLVRFIGPIRQNGIPFLTHDVLVTSGDFANPDLVNTSVYNHTFHWYSHELQNPQGSINLIHAVPQKETIYNQLLEMKTGQQVKITGFEVLRINAFDAKGRRYLWWQDSGCNTLMITRVEIINP
jgi:hypothetical protein